MRLVAKDIRRLIGLRLAAGDDRPLPYSARFAVAEAYAIADRLDKAERSLQREYMAHHSASFAKAEPNNAEAERLRNANFGRAAKRSKALAARLAQSGPQAVARRA